MSKLTATMEDIATMVNTKLNQLLPVLISQESRLLVAMRYASLSGGKRLRPFLVVATARMFQVEETSSIRVAAAVEMLHTYTLVHDDLPSMDNDDLRRGMPTCHRQFDEATAILAGDALLTQSFEILANPETHTDSSIRSELILEMARAAGAYGTVGGQMIDLLAESTPEDVITITRLQKLKTGCLIGFSCEAGAILGKAPHSLRSHILAYAYNLGLAFQIRDDVLDVEGNIHEMGKAVRKDKFHGKATFVSLLGVEKARAQSAILVDQAISYLDIFGDEATLLRQVADFIIKRRY